MIGNRIADKIIRASKTSPQINSVANEEVNIGRDREILRERCKSSEKREQIIKN